VPNQSTTDSFRVKGTGITVTGASVDDYNKLVGQLVVCDECATGFTSSASFDSHLSSSPSCKVAYVHEV